MKTRCSPAELILIPCITLVQFVQFIQFVTVQRCLPRLLTILAALFGVSSAAAQTYVVNVFMLESCTISQAFTDELIRLHQDFSSDSIQFVGWFPNQVSTWESIEEFRKTSDLPFVCRIDSGAVRARRYGVTITPEVAIVSVADQQVLYRGRVNDLFVRVGQRRGVVTQHDVRAVLRALTDGMSVTPRVTTAIGCILPVWR